jgi:hypothetical protein
MDSIEDELQDFMPIDDFEAEMGRATVLQSFQQKVNPHNKKEGKIAGCKVDEGNCF